MINPISVGARRVSLEGLQQSVPGGAQGVAPGGASFGDTLRQAIEKVSEVQETSASQVGAFLRGENVELHQVMAATEEAGIALEMLIEVRNKFTEAYRTVINMQS